MRNFREVSADCAVPGAELLDVAEHYPEIDLLDDDLQEPARFSLIATRNGLDPEQAAAQFALSPIPAINDRHLALRENLTQLHGRAMGWRTDYRAVRTITELKRANGIVPNRPNILSGNALLVDRRARKVGLQVRSSTVETFSGLLHIVGGAFEPNRDHSLAETAVREVREETKGLKVEVDDCIAILQQETDTNYSMVVFLGVPVSDWHSRDSHWEGSMHWFALDDLPAMLAEQSYGWVCTGKQAVLVWLALGCPVGGTDFAFGRRRGRMLLDRYHALARRL